MRRKIQEFIIIIVLSMALVIIMFSAGIIANSLYQVTEIADQSTWLSFLGSIIGTGLAVLGAYLISDLENYKKKKEYEKYMIGVVKAFLTTEIEFNNNLLNIAFIKERIKQAKLKWEDNVTHSISEGSLKLDEFHNIKYELIKIDSNLANEVILYFSYLMRIDKNNGLGKLNLSELENLIEISENLSDIA